MAHMALYRTWRPKLFRDIVGQQHITQTLQNALKEKRLSHAYLFSGPRGTGKTSAAKILAKAVNCERGPAEEPCNVCHLCVRIAEGSVMDVVEIDAASNRGVEEIRDIRDKVKYAPTEVRQKVYIIDEVHMLTTEAFNALLKTLEEPPGHVMFVLATTEPYRLPATILSRCQRFDFRRIPPDEQVECLARICREEGVTAEPAALTYIARLSDGGMRDAISLLDQAIAYGGQHVTYSDVLAMTGGLGAEQFEKLVSAIAAQNVGAALELIETLMAEGKSAEKCMENLIHYLRDALMLRLVPNAGHATGRILNPDRLNEALAHLSNERLFHMIDVLNHYQTEMKYSAQPQTMFEVAIMKLCSDRGAGPAVPAPPESGPADGALAELREKVQQLERQLAQLMKSGVERASAQRDDGLAPRPSPPRSAARNSNMAAPVRLDPFLRSPDPVLWQQVKDKWAQVLQRVKERKITVHAWLIDGEPVSAADQTVLIAFKSAMHRETTEKPAHKQLIEQVLQETFGKPLKLATVMSKEWKEAQSGFREPPEPMELKAEDADKSQEEWIDEAIRLFGENIVVIKE